MGKLCIKLRDEEVKDLFNKLDNLLRKKKVRLIELFESNPSHTLSFSSISTGDEDPLMYDMQVLGFYFYNYTYEEMMGWLQQNIDLVDKPIKSVSRR